MDVTNSRKLKKDQLSVVILTRDHIIQGEVHVLPGTRLTDFVNSKPDNDFIAVTNAEVFPISQSKDILKTKFLAINKSYITMIYPVSS